MSDKERAAISVTIALVATLGLLAWHFGRGGDLPHWHIPMNCPVDVGGRSDGSCPD